MAENHLTVRNNSFPTTETLANLTSLASKLVNSNALPSTIKNQAQLMMVLLAGKEAGMGAIESLNSFYLVNGKITIYGAAQCSQLKRAGYKLKWGKCDEKEVNLTLVNPDGDEHTERYTWEQAVKTGQTGKEVWVKYPMNMMRYKCLGNACRFFAAETLNGHYLREEMDGNAAPTEVMDAEIGDDNQPTEAVAEADNQDGNELPQ